MAVDRRAWTDEDLSCEVQGRWRRSGWGIGGREAAGIAIRGASKCQPECRRTRDGSYGCDRVRGTRPRGQISDKQEASRSLR
jgi:hypothetical protein